MRGRWRKFDPEMSLSTDFTEKQAARFDALFISTKNNPKRVYGLLQESSRLNIANKIFILSSTYGDSPYFNRKIKNIHKDFVSFCKIYFPNFEHITWDLPQKRNFSIWFSKRNSFEKILLLDDDVRFANLEKSAFNLYPALNNSWVAGAYSIGEFDTSLIGEVAMRLGIKRPAFLSGNCLAINIEKFTPFFPDIYNEDWLSFLPAIIANKASIVGPVFQLARRCTNYKQVARFQEFGEIIADELYSLIVKPIPFTSLSDLIAKINHIDYWFIVLKDRDEWLKKLENYCFEEGNREIDLCIVKAAREELFNIDATVCVSFISKWQQDIERWSNRFTQLT